MSSRVPLPGRSDVPGRASDADSGGQDLFCGRAYGQACRKAKDKCLLRLIRRYLETGIMADNVERPTGDPQRSPYSPLPGSIMVDAFDQVVSHGHRFIRYADGVRSSLKAKRQPNRPRADAPSGWKRT